MYEKIKKYFKENPQIFTDLIEQSNYLSPDDEIHPMEDFNGDFKTTPPHTLAVMIKYSPNFNPQDKYYENIRNELVSYNSKTYIQHLSDWTITYVWDVVEDYYNESDEIYQLYQEAGLI